MGGEVRENAIELLVIDDNEADRELFELILKRGGPDADLRLDGVSTFREGLERAREHSFTAIVLDLNLPDGQGPGMLERLRESGIETPVYLHSGDDDPDLIAEARRRGAAGYLVKAEIDVPAFLASLFEAS